MASVWKSETGRVRSNNEDAILIDEDQGIFLLADGMGGHNAGEVTSDIAVKEAYAFLQQNALQLCDTGSLLNIMEEALCRAHRAVKDRAATDEGLHGMGTTLIELYIRDGSAYLCHAGDSRAYLFRDSLIRMTRDHTAGDSYIELGLTSEQVSPRMRHALTKAVGPHDCPVPDKKAIELRMGDILLLCSDGLTDMLTDEEIQGVVFEHKADLNGLADALIRNANNKGGKDNISLIAVKK